MRKRSPTPGNAEDENMFVPLAPVIQRDNSERKQIRIELAKSVPLPPSLPPGNYLTTMISINHRSIFSAPSTPPPPPPPMYDPEEDEQLSNMATHLQDHIGEEEMELDDMDEPQPESTEDTNSSMNFPENLPLRAPVSLLYDEAGESNDIPSDSNAVSTRLSISFSTRIPIYLLLKGTE